MTLKENILNILNEANLSFSILKEYLGVEDDILKDALEELIDEKRIKYLKGQELYKAIKFQGLDLGLLFDFFKKRLYLTNFQIKKHFKAKQAEIDIAISTLIHDKKIKKIDTFGVYSILLEGKIDLKDKFGFVSVDGFSEDFFIPFDYISNSYNGDTVLIAPVEATSKKMVAVVVGVVDRAKKMAFGILKVKNKKYPKYFIRPIQNSFPVDINLVGDINPIDLGRIVQVELEYIGFKVNGRIKNVVGAKDDPGIDISLIALTHGFEVQFSEDTLNELESIPDTVLDSELESRIDYSDKNIITIDGDGSKDFDDAVSLEVLDNGNYLLGVYIADVAHYVKENTPLDHDALKRGTSCYLADRVIPMIPRKLSNGICSLNPNVKRLV